MRNRKLLWSTITLLFWVAASPSAYAACNNNEWLIESFTLRQSNGFDVEVTAFGPYPGNINGRAAYYPAGRRDQPWVHGDLANAQLLPGSNHLHFLVHWKNGSTGSYDADVSSDGKLINGKTADADHPESNATWTTNVTLKCCVPQPGYPCMRSRVN